MTNEALHHLSFSKLPEFCEFITNLYFRLSIDITEESMDEDDDVSEYQPSFNISLG